MSARGSRDACIRCARRAGPPGRMTSRWPATTLDALRAGRDVALPRFDKARRPPPAASVTGPARRAPPDVLEGWCLGVPPQAPAELVEPINALERDEDPDGTWRRHVQRSARHRLPGAVVAGSTACCGCRGRASTSSPRWRWQQEQTRRAAEHRRPDDDRARRSSASCSTSSASAGMRCGRCRTSPTVRWRLTTHAGCATTCCDGMQWRLAERPAGGPVAPALHDRCMPHSVTVGRLALLR